MVIKRNFQVRLVSPEATTGRALQTVPPIIRPLVELGSNPATLTPMIDKIVRSLGFNSFTYSAVRSSPYNPDSRMYLWSSADPAWLRQYSEQGLVEIDPRLKALDSCTPLLWERSAFPDSRENREFFDVAIAHGEGSGIAIAIRDPSPVGSVLFSLSAPLPALDDWRRAQIMRELGDILTLGTYVHELCFSGTVAKLFAPPVEGTRVSKREIECLQLAAKGLNSAEIASALGIGVRTVHYHVANLLARLHAANRQEAIARAVAAGLIVV